LTRQVEGEFCRALAYQQAFGLVQLGQFASGFKFCILLRRGRQRFAQAFPGLVGIAVVGINAEQFRLNLSIGQRQAGEVQFHFRSGAGHIVIVIMPDQHGEFSVIERGKCRYIWIFAHPGFENGLRVQGGAAGDGHAPAAHFCKHAKDVQHGQIKAVAGEGAKPGKGRLVFKFERPREGA